MNNWRYLEQGPNDEAIQIVISEEEILKTYFEYWKHEMTNAGLAHEITEQGCIDDFVVVFWAERVPQ